MNAHKWTTLVAACWSALTAALGLWWIVQPSAYLLGGGGEDASALAVQVDAPWLVAVGATGAAAALALRSGRCPSVLRCLLLALTTGLALLCLVVPGHTPLLTVAYSFAFTGPIVLIAALLSRAFGLGTKGTSVMVGTPLAAGLLFSATITVIVGSHWASFGVAGFAVFGALAVTSYRVHRGRCGTCGRPGADWTHPESAARWGRKATKMAALMPLPYGLVRLTWFTPWPVAFPDDAGWEIRLIGILLGFASEGGAILTHGLIHRWGEVWPRWVPVLHGRRVPVKGPTFAAFAAAVMLTLLVIFISETALTSGGDVLALVLFVPLGLWGPLLAVAAMGYYYRRRGACSECHEGPTTDPCEHGASRNRAAAPDRPRRHDHAASTRQG